MKLGVNTFIWAAEFGPAQFRLLPQIKAHGFDGVEVPLFRPDQFAAQEIRRSCQDVGLEVTVCSVLVSEFSLIAEDAVVRKQTIAHLREAIHATAEAGARLIAGPLYSPVGYLPGRRRTSDEWARAVDGYRELVPVLVETGVTLAIEPLNRFETYFLNTAADAVALCEAVGSDHVGILYDTFHANIEEKKLPASILATGRHLKHFHSCENDRGTPGNGHIEWSAVFEALSRVGYDGWLTIESFGFALGDLSSAAAIWRDIEPTPDAIAYDGVRFLRSQIATSPAALPS